MKIPAVRALSALLLVVSVLPSSSAAPSKADSIPALIESLTELESIQTFFSRTFEFKEFPPLDEAPLAKFPLAADASAQDVAVRAMIRLVETGPEALPYLIAHLDDRRETKTIVTDEYARSVGPSSYLDFRRGDSREEAALELAGLPRDNPGPDYDGDLDDYTLTIGDMCFSLIGMITNRSYYVVVDEFGAQLNSPVRSERIVTGVREKWGANPEAVDLYQQLKGDLESGDPRFANSAATRLLYYFPSISDNLVLARLGGLIKDHEPGSNALADYLEAISWSSDPRIMSTLRRLLTTATDPAAIAAAARVYKHSSDPRGRIQLVQMTDRLKLRRDPSYVKATRDLLTLNLITYPRHKSDTLRRFLEGAGPYATTSACLVCESIENAPVIPLLPLLANQSKSTGERYLIRGEGAERWPEDDDYLPYRTCDRAYETISRLLGDTNAVATGSPAEMQEKIAALAKRLTGPPSSWRFTKAEIQARQKAQGKYRRH